MSASITGLGSGFNIDSWVSQLVAVKKSSSVTPLEQKLAALQNKNTALTQLKSKYSTLQSALNTFTKSMYDSTSDMWTNTSVTSSNSAYATATSTGAVASGVVDLSIEQIATSTTARSIHTLGTITPENASSVKFTNLANSQAKSGTFSMFLDGKEFKINIAESDTLQNVMDKIHSASNGKIQAEISSDGKFSINAYKEIENADGSKEFVVDKDAKLSLGTSTDTSNLASALKLHDSHGGYGYTSAYSVSSVDAKAAMASAESGLGEVKFFNEEGKDAKITINGVDFKIDENTTLNGLISKINSNSDVNVKASYDSLTNKLILTSTQTGQNNISLSEDGTNLLNVLGLTQGEGDNEILAVGSQTLGQNAIAYINGNKVISTSNTITGESSGISNLSITIKKPTSDYSGNKDDEKTVSLDIEPDYTKVKESLKTFVDAYNDVVSTTKNLVSSDGTLGHDSSLNSILTSLRSITSKISNNAGEFSMLSEIGISSSHNDVSKLEIDDKKLDKALKENFDSVKYLLSDGYVAKEDTGLFDELASTVNNVLDNQNGYFANKTDSIDSQITRMNSRIERANSLLANYEARVTRQFNQMDSTISALTSQLSTFQAYLG